MMCWCAFVSAVGPLECCELAQLRSMGWDLGRFLKFAQPQRDVVNAQGLGTSSIRSVAL
jgi:hypothetical protein